MSQAYPPLLEAGFHEVQVSQLEEVFASSFAQPERRRQLIARLKTYLQEIDDRLDLTYELWIDGSFTSLKVKPNDIDMLFVFRREELNSLDRKEKIIFRKLFIDRETIKLRYRCDVYFCLEEEIDRKSYWRGWFGFSRDEQPKGIARITRAA